MLSPGPEFGASWRASLLPSDAGGVSAVVLRARRACACATSTAPVVAAASTAVAGGGTGGVASGGGVGAAVAATASATAPAAASASAPADAVVAATGVAAAVTPPAARELATVRARSCSCLRMISALIKTCSAVLLTDFLHASASLSWQVRYLNSGNDPSPQPYSRFTSAIAVAAEALPVAAVIASINTRFGSPVRSCSRSRSVSRKRGLSRASAFEKATWKERISPTSE